MACEENCDDEKLLRIEAEGAVKEIAFAVDSVSISKVLPNSEDLVYLNVKTKEGDDFCVELSVQGFRVSAQVFLGDVMHLPRGNLIRQECPTLLGYLMWHVYN